MVIGSFIPFLLPDSPDRASFLRADEKAFIKQRLEHDSGTTSGTVGLNEQFQWSSLKGAFMDWKIYLATFMYWGTTVRLCAIHFSPVY